MEQMAIWYCTVLSVFCDLCAVFVSPVVKRKHDFNGELVLYRFSVETMLSFF